VTRILGGEMAKVKETTANGDEIAVAVDPQGAALGVHQKA
jgi:hypothetical protein